MQVPSGDVLRVGMVGCGNMAYGDYVPALADLTDVYRVVAVADPSDERRMLVGAALKLGAADCHHDPTDLFARSDVDVVMVVTPPHVRVPLVLAAIAAGKHVLSEKPLATVPADAALVVSAADAAGVLLAVMHNYLFLPEVLAVDEAVRSGEIGAVEAVILNALGVVDEPGITAYNALWRHDVALSGGGVLMDMMHLVYLVELLLGRPVEGVSAAVAARAAASSVEDIALCRLETDHNTGLVNVGWGVGPGGLVVGGTTGRVTVQYEGGGTSPFAPLASIELIGQAGTRRLEPARQRNPVTLVLADFAEAVRAGRPPRADGRAALHALEIVIASYASAALGRTVRLPLEPGDPVYDHGAAGISELELPSWSRVAATGLYNHRKAVQCT